MAASSKEENKSQLKNIAAERATLAGICQFGNDVYIDCSEILNIDCFTTDSHQKYYKILESIHNEGSSCDIPSIVAKATTLGYNELVSGREQNDYLKALFEYGVKKENILAQAKVIRKLDIARKGQELARKIFVELGKINGEEAIDTILSKMEKPVLDYTLAIDGVGSKRTRRIGEAVDEWLDYVIQNPNRNVGIPSPWDTYNRAIGGGRRRGGVYLTAARPKVGKSSLSINDAIFVAGLDVPVLYLDTEMDERSQLPRILANLSGIDCTEIESGMFVNNEFWHTKLKEGARKLKSLPLSYQEIAGKSFGEIISLIRRWIVQEVGTTNGRTNNCLIIYDYFKLMDTSGLNNMKEYQVLGYQIQDLCNFCKQYDVPCSAYVQLNRDGAEDPSSVDLSQSDRLLWLCSSLAILARKSGEEIAQENGEHGNMKLIVTPDQRFGPGLDDGDWINLSFQKAKCRIDELGTRFKQRPSDAFETESSDDGDESEF